MAIATVVFFNRIKGFGFATPESGLENDVFLHVSHLPASRKFLLEGERISYDPGDRNGRPIALNILVIAPAPQPVQDDGKAADKLAALGAQKSGA